MKDNADPVVHAVVSRRVRRTAPIVVGYGNDPNETYVEDSSDRVFLPNRSVRVALRAAAAAAADEDEDALGLLRRAGLLSDDDDDDNSDRVHGRRVVPFGVDAASTFRDRTSSSSSSFGAEPHDADEVFETIRDVTDPEHPSRTLEQLDVVGRDRVSFSSLSLSSSPAAGAEGTPDVVVVRVRFTPTVPHCSMATLIGLSLRVRLSRSLPSRYRVFVEITPGTHSSENAINRQLNDKERVAAALENEHLLGVVEKCLRGTTTTTT